MAFPGSEACTECETGQCQGPLSLTKSLAGTNLVYLAYPLSASCCVRASQAEHMSKHLCYGMRCHTGTSDACELKTVDRGDHQVGLSLHCVSVAD